jgi:fructose-specific component phosphotransferase system IIB-like protein
MDVKLVMFKADGSRRDFPLRKGRTIVGRTNDCDLRIPLSSVSRRQCEFLVEGEKISLRDLGSSNGTYHNHIRVQEVDLVAGDEIGVGPVAFTVVVDGQPADIEPVRSMVGGAAAKAITSSDEEVTVLEGDTGQADFEVTAKSAGDNGSGRAAEKPEAVLPKALKPAKPAAVKPAATKPAPAKTEEPSALSGSGSGDDLLDFVEEELDSPTADIEDPIAALEALANELDEDEDDHK